MKKRDFLKTLPVWVTPIIGVVTLPAHAQTSPPFPDKPDKPDEPDEPEITCPPEENTYVYQFDRQASTRQNPLLCIRGENDCPAEYRILFAKPVLPLRYSETIEGTIPAFTGCVDLGHLLPDSVDFNGQIWEIYEYCIQVKQHPTGSEAYTSYCSNNNTGGGGR